MSALSLCRLSICWIWYLKQNELNTELEQQSQKMKQSDLQHVSDMLQHQYNENQLRRQLNDLQRRYDADKRKAEEKCSIM